MGAGRLERHLQRPIHRCVERVRLAANVGALAVVVLVQRQLGRHQRLRLGGLDVGELERHGQRHRRVGRQHRARARAVLPPRVLEGLRDHVCLALAEPAD